MPGDTSIWKKLLAKVHKLDKRHVKVGILGQAAIEPVDGGITMVELGTMHEFGTADGRIPERSYIRSTLNSGNDELKQICAKLASDIVNGRRNVDEALKILGEFGVAQVRGKITKTDIPPPLKPATIAAKGSSKPLVDTGALLNSISYELGTDDGSE